MYHTATACGWLCNTGGCLSCYGSSLPDTHCQSSLSLDLAHGIPPRWPLFLLNSWHYQINWRHLDPWQLDPFDPGPWLSCFAWITIVVKMKYKIKALHKSYLMVFFDIQMQTVKKKSNFPPSKIVIMQVSHIWADPISSIFFLFHSWLPRKFYTNFTCI